MSVLYDSNGTEWVKKNDTNKFDVLIMGSYMGAEIWDVMVFA